MVIPQLGYGGAEGLFVRVANYLAAYHDVTAVLFMRDYGSGSYNNTSEAPQCPIVALDGKKKSRLARWVSRWRQFRSLKANSDVAISFLSGPNLLNILVGTTTPSIVSVLGSRGREPDLNKIGLLLWKNLLDPLIYQHSERIVSVSHGVSREVAKVGGPLDRIITIEGHIDSRKLVTFGDEPIESEFEVLKGQALVVACGRLHAVKGYQYLIPIFAATLRKVPGAKLLILGDGPYLDTLVKLCYSVGLKVSTSDCDANVIFAGFKRTPSRYFRLARIFVQCSIAEGLPNALIEAVATGVPILVADCPGGVRSGLTSDPLAAMAINPSALPQELDNGTLMPPIYDTQSHSVWVLRLVAALLEKRPRRSIAERTRATARFDLDKTGTQWLDLIEDVCRGRDQSQQLAGSASPVTAYSNRTHD
jgi:glycosyltransferase involved in cell wall biosynthesis